MKALKYFYLLLLITALLVPHLDITLFKKTKLSGYFIKPEKPLADLKSWLNGDYQRAHEEYTEQQIISRPFMIRLKNEIDFRFFNFTSNDFLEIGKNNQLIEKPYLKAYLGEDYIGDSLIKKKLHQLSLIKETLEKAGKKFLVVLAPGKVSFMPEIIPDHYITLKKEKTNKAELLKGLQENNIDFIDMLAFFNQQKSKVPYPLFTRSGIHWSVYGSFLAADTISNYIRNNYDINLAKMIFKKIEESDKARDSDNDIEMAFNLIYPLPPEKYGYPVVEYQTDSTTVKPKVIVIADSFYWRFMANGTHDQLFHPESTFWYYFNQTWPESTLYRAVYTKDLDLNKEIKKRDLVILMVTESNLPSLDFGFCDRFEKECLPNELK